MFDLLVHGRYALPVRPGGSEVPLFAEARREAMVRMTTDQDLEKTRAVFSVCLWSNDDIVLVRFGPRGGHTCVWNFTTGGRSYRGVL